jgi:serine/threonine protein kinase/tetratricopeptide (TPR) repeat protein
MAPPLSLGPFDLSRPLGRGGMGEVWHAVHTASGVPVAIKVLSGVHAARRSFHALFRDEVRAVAALDHPGVVRVYDAGSVSAEAEAASGGALQAGCPWLAMELASRGALSDLPGPADWTELRDGIAAILDALAHAHARGVIHRDLKPGNVLLCGPDDPRPGLKLTDFGLAFAMDRDGDRVGMGGTPQYMAPEQFRGDWRETGPWTDLYAFGCAVWEQVTGAPPFPGADVAALASAHAKAPLPALEPRFPIPAGLDRWLHGLLAKRPLDRVARAADAARQLAMLPEVRGASLVRSAPRATATLAVCLEDPSAEWRLADLDEDDLATEQVALPTLTPVFPETWALPVVELGPRLVGAGLGLSGLRDPPLVARGPERDRLWAQLGAVYASRTPRLVALRGPRGVGKTRLADWLSQRADELALAEVVHVPHHQGVDGALTRVLRLGGLSPEDRRTRAERVVTELGASAVAVALVGAVAGGERRLGPAERWGALRVVLELRCRRRPVLVWLRDAALASDALGFAAALLSERLPVLVGLDLDDDEPPVDVDGLARLLATPGAEVLDLAPLSGHALQALGEGLGLEAPLAAAVASRASGVPLFAVQLVQDWVQRGALVAGGAGFVLAPGETGRIPDALHALWTSRVRALGPHAEAALQVAAALGSTFELSAWEHACAALGRPLPADLVDGLLVQRLARRTDGGLVFVHALLRESLLRSLPADEVAAVHRACAAGRATLPREGARLSGIGAHLFAAGDLEQAFAVSLECYRVSDHAGNIYDATDAITRAEQILTTLRVPDTDARWAEVYTRRAILELSRGRPTEAYARASQAEWAARRTDRAEHLVESLRVQAVSCSMLGRTEPAEAAAAECLLLARTHGLGAWVGRAYNTLGDLARLTGRLDEALTAFRAAAEHPDASRITQADAWVGQGACHVQRGELNAAERCYRAAEPLVANDSVGAAVNSGLGEVARKRGRYDEACVHYARAIERLALLGADRAVVPSMNLALVHLARGAWAEARALVEPLQARLRASGRKALASACSALLATCAAADGDADGFTARCGEVTRVREKGFTDADMGWALERAGELWADAGRADLARVAFSEALEHLRQDAVAAARVQARL